jgi:hypothetical protein
VAQLHQAAQVAAAQQAAGVVQGTPQDGGGGQAQPGGEQTPGYTYRNRARRKACEKPTVSCALQPAYPLVTSCQAMRSRKSALRRG